jgi:hypothetical protein
MNGYIQGIGAESLKGHSPLHSSHFATGCSEESLGGNQVLIFLINYISSAI